MRGGTEGGKEITRSQWADKVGEENCATGLNPNSAEKGAYIWKPVPAVLVLKKGL